MDRKGRDPRLNALEEDFFASTNRAPPNHSRARDDGKRRQQHVRVVFEHHQGPSSNLLRGFMNPSYYSTPPIRDGGSFWHFSRKEINDLTLATLAFALALALMQVGGMLGILSSQETPFVLFVEMAIWGTLYIFSLGPAFLLHEMAHKITAPKYLALPLLFCAYGVLIRRLDLRPFFEDAGHEGSARYSLMAARDL